MQTNWIVLQGPGSNPENIVSIFHTEIFFMGKLV